MGPVGFAKLRYCLCDSEVDSEAPERISYRYKKFGSKSQRMDGQESGDEISMCVEANGGSRNYDLNVFVARI